MISSPTPASPIEALKAGFRRACVRRLVGDEKGAVSVLRDEIPSLVVSWAKSTALDPSEKKAKLKEMFDDESSRADELAVAFDLFAGRFEARVAELVQKQVSTLANRMNEMALGLQSSLQQMEDLAQKLSQINRVQGKGKRKIDSSIEPVSLPEEKSPVVPSGLPKPVSNELASESEESPVLTPIGEMIPEPKISSDHKPPQSKISDTVPEDHANLDPPSGTGLRFDEIEEMIDEILSYETN
jgi:hypothetical protein